METGLEKGSVHFSYSAFIFLEDCKIDSQVFGVRVQERLLELNTSGTLFAFMSKSDLNQKALEQYG